MASAGAGALATVAAANVLFAITFPVSVIALRGFAPAVATELRFVLAACALAPAGLPALRRATAADRRRLALLASLGLWLQMVLIYEGIDASRAAIAAVIVGLEPVLIALWAALLLSERFTGRRAAGLVVGLCGSLLVAGVGSGGSHPLGLLFLLGTGLTWSWYTVASKSLLGRMQPLELIAAVSLLGAAFGLLPAVADAAAFGGWHSPGPSSGRPSSISGWATACSATSCGTGPCTVCPPRWWAPACTCSPHWAQGCPGWHCANRCPPPSCPVPGWCCSACGWRPAGHNHRPARPGLIAIWHEPLPGSIIAGWDMGYGWPRGRCGTAGWTFGAAALSAAVAAGRHSAGRRRMEGARRLRLNGGGQRVGG